MIDNVSVLYVDPRGPYPWLVADWWDETRDARKYAGPNPIVAHPPCGAWGQLRRRYLGHDRELAVIAVKQVRTFGGVLEHPRGSLLWADQQLPKPGDDIDAWGGRSYVVEQVSWGHPCRKPTWLYVVGVPDVVVRTGIRTGGEPTHQIWGQWGSHRHNPNLKGAHAAIRRRSPQAFAEWLVELASQAKRA